MAEGERSSVSCATKLKNVQVGGSPFQLRVTWTLTADYSWNVNGFLAVLCFKQAAGEKTVTVV